MTRGNRYSLLYEEKSGNKIYLQSENNLKKSNKKNVRKKFPLTQIDAFTTRLNGEDDLKFAFEYFLKEDLEEGKFYIEYVQDKKKKTMKVAYKDDEILAYFSNRNVGKTYVREDEKYETYVANLLYALTSNPKLYRYLIEDKYMNKYVLSKIENYLLAKENKKEELMTYAFKEVKSSLLNYRLIRNVEDGMKAYNKEKRKNEEALDYKGQYRLF